MISDANSIHTERWVNSLAQRGYEIYLYSIHPPKDKRRFSDEKITLNIYTPSFIETFIRKIPLIKQFASIIELHKLKKFLKEVNPDIVHAHYATHNGLLAALSGFHPFILSVWGSDVYTNPNDSRIAKKKLQYMLKKADRILSTSYVMAKETHKYTDKEIEITPFGVDTENFKPIDKHCSSDCFIIGNVKTLSPKYGIDILISAAALVIKNNPERNIKLEIYGEGPQKQELISLAKSLNIDDRVAFKGFVHNSLLPEVYNSFSVSVSVSDSESFGVVAVEAMACGCPVITSDADGFTEVVDNGKTGFIVPKKDIEATANAIQKFIDNPLLRDSMGKTGRQRVLKLYNWDSNVAIMEKIYQQYNKKTS